MFFVENGTSDKRLVVWIQCAGGLFCVVDSKFPCIVLCSPVHRVCTANFSDFKRTGWNLLSVTVSVRVRMSELRLNGAR